MRDSNDQAAACEVIEDDRARGYPWLHVRFAGRHGQHIELYEPWASGTAPYADDLSIELEHDEDCGAVDIELPKPVALAMARRIIDHYERQDAKRAAQESTE